MQRLRGISAVESGYAGGITEDPSYREVCSGSTGHVEVIQVTFDPETIQFADILRVFFHLHDPTTLNQQGNDIGTQHRSVIFFHDDQQREIAEQVKLEIEREGIWKDPIVTSIEPLQNYYTAEEFHQNYFNLNPMQPYCAAVIPPKLHKLEKQFAHLLKQSSTG